MVRYVQYVGRKEMEIVQRDCISNRDVDLAAEIYQSFKASGQVR